MVQVEIRDGWPRERTPAQRLPFDEEQWRRKPFKNIIGLAKAQNVKRVLKLTEHTVHRAHTHALASYCTYCPVRRQYMSPTSLGLLIDCSILTNQVIRMSWQ